MQVCSPYFRGKIKKNLLVRKIPHLVLVKTSIIHKELRKKVIFKYMDCTGLKTQQKNNNQRVFSRMSGVSFFSVLPEGASLNWGMGDCS